MGTVRRATGPERREANCEVVPAEIELGGRERMTEESRPVRATVNVAATCVVTSSSPSVASYCSDMFLVTGTDLTARLILPSSAEDRLFGWNRMTAWFLSSRSRYDL